MINNHDEDDDYVYEEDYNDDGDDDTSRGTQSYECLAPALPCRLLILKPINIIVHRNILSPIQCFAKNDLPICCKGNCFQNVS